MDRGSFAGTRRHGVLLQFDVVADPATPEGREMIRLGEETLQHARIHD